jgi:hypothetical protein
MNQRAGATDQVNRSRGHPAGLTADGFHARLGHDGPAEATRLKIGTGLRTDPWLSACRSCLRSRRPLRTSDTGTGRWRCRWRSSARGRSPRPSLLRRSVPCVPATRRTDTEVARVARQPRLRCEDLNLITRLPADRERGRHRAGEPGDDSAQRRSAAADQVACSRPRRRLSALWRRCLRSRRLYSMPDSPQYRSRCRSRSFSARSQRRRGSVSTGRGKGGSLAAICRAHSRVTSMSRATWAARRVSKERERGQRSGDASWAGCGAKQREPSGTERERPSTGPLSFRAFVLTGSG